MEESEHGGGFAPRTRIPALLRLGATVLAASLAGCPGVQISRNADSAGPESTPATESAPTIGSATLVWEAPTENIDGTPITDLAGYRIHFGLSSDELNQFVEVSGADSTTYVINGLAAGTYYFAVGAYNSFGVEGALSKIASKSF